MPSRTHNLLAAVSLAACVAVAALWARSGARWEVAVYQTDARTAWMVSSLRGGFASSGWSAMTGSCCP
jgi:hypothetical protein